MRDIVYKNAKLEIFEKSVAGEITESQRDELLAMLESKKKSSELTADAIEDFFDDLEDAYPALKDDIKKLAKKIEKSAGGNDDESSDDEKEEEPKEDETEVSEAALDLLDLIDSVF